MDEKPLNCPLCHNRPRLAGYGIDDEGRLFVHIKVYKAQQIKADVYIHGGSVTLRCYKCSRYHKINIRQPNNVRLSKPRTQDLPVTAASPSGD